MRGSCGQTLRCTAVVALCLAVAVSGRPPMYSAEFGPLSKSDEHTHVHRPVVASWASNAVLYVPVYSKDLQASRMAVYNLTSPNEQPKLVGTAEGQFVAQLLTFGPYALVETLPTLWASNVTNYAAMVAPDADEPVWVVDLKGNDLGVTWVLEQEMAFTLRGNGTFVSTASLAAFSLKNGSILWEVNSTNFTGAPVYHHGMVYVVEDGKVTSFTMDGTQTKMELPVCGMKSGDNGEVMGANLTVNGTTSVAYLLSYVTADQSMTIVCRFDASGRTMWSLTYPYAMSVVRVEGVLDEVLLLGGFSTFGEDNATMTHTAVNGVTGRVRYNATRPYSEDSHPKVMPGVPGCNLTLIVEDRNHTSYGLCWRDNDTWAHISTLWEGGPYCHSSAYVSPAMGECPNGCVACASKAGVSLLDLSNGTTIWHDMQPAHGAMTYMNVVFASTKHTVIALSDNKTFSWLAATNSSGNSEKGLPKGAIIAIAVGSLVLVGGVCVALVMKVRGPKEHPSMNETPLTEMNRV